MSIESLSIAMMHSRSRGTTKLVLLGIANHDGDGGAWPAVSTLMRYAGGIDRRRVQRCLLELEQLGEIRRLRGQGGDHSTADHRRPNLYRFLLVCPHDCDRSSQHRTARSTPMMPLEGLGAVEGPHAVEGPPDGQATGGGGGPQTAQTIPLTQPSQVKSINPGTRERERDPDYCPNTRSHEHQRLLDEACNACGLLPSQAYNGGDVLWLEVQR